MQRYVGEVLAGEGDVKKGERCFPREVQSGRGLGGSWQQPGWFLGLVQRCVCEVLAG